MNKNLGLPANNQTEPFGYEVLGVVINARETLDVIARTQAEILALIPEKDRSTYRLLPIATEDEYNRECIRIAGENQRRASNSSANRKESFIFRSNDLSDNLGGSLK